MLCLGSLSNALYIIDTLFIWSWLGNRLHSKHSNRLDIEMNHPIHRNVHEHINHYRILPDGETILEYEGVFFPGEYSSRKMKCVDDFRRDMEAYLYHVNSGSRVKLKRQANSGRVTATFFTSYPYTPVAEFSTSKCTLLDCPVNTYKTFRYTEE